MTIIDLKKYVKNNENSSEKRNKSVSERNKVLSPSDFFRSFEYYHELELDDGSLNNCYSFIDQYVITSKMLYLNFTRKENETISFDAPFSIVYADNELFFYNGSAKVYINKESFHNQFAASRVKYNHFCRTFFDSWFGNEIVDLTGILPFTEEVISYLEIASLLNKRSYNKFMDKATFLMKFKDKELRFMFK